MSRHLSTAAVVALLLVSALVAAHPYAPARGQTPSGEYRVEYTNTLKVGYYNATEITITSPSIIEYATRSNATIVTAFMDQQELNGFTTPTAVENSIFNQQGTDLYNALLEGPGAYYLVEYARGAAANVTALYIVDSNVDVRDSTTSAGELVTIAPGQTFTLPLHIETLGSSSEVEMVGASTRVVQYALLDNSTGATVFRSPDVTATNFTVYPRVSLGYNETLQPGLYIMGITDESPDPAYVYFSYVIFPAYVNPYLYELGPPTPTGVAAYGVYNDSGTIVPYTVETDSIVGFAQISQLQATDNESGSHLCSLQENAVLQVNDTGGASFDYWPQNVLSFDTQSSIVTYRDNVLNVTGNDAQLTNKSITGTGTTRVDDNDGLIQTYYGNYDSNYTYRYTLPQSWVLYTNETVEKGAGVLISVGERALDGATPNEVTWFDKILIHDTDVASAAFVVSGKAYTPAGASSLNGMFYDAELVFGGGAGGMAATYNLTADLALFYSSHGAVPFPSVYTFGDDTAEAAYNIAVTYANGMAVAQSGTPNYGFLTNDFNASLASLVAAAIAGRPSSGTSYLAYAEVGAAAVVLVVVAVAIAMRRRPTSAPPETVAAAQPPSSFCSNCGTQLEPDSLFCPSCGARQAADPPEQEKGPDHGA